MRRLHCCGGGVPSVREAPPGRGLRGAHDPAPEVRCSYLHADPLDALLSMSMRAQVLVPSSYDSTSAEALHTMVQTLYLIYRIDDLWCALEWFSWDQLMIRADLQYLLCAGQYSVCLQTHQIPAGALKARGSQRRCQLSLSRPSTSPWPCLQAQAARPPNQGSAQSAAAHALSCERTRERLDAPSGDDDGRGWHLS